MATKTVKNSSKTSSSDKIKNLEQALQRANSRITFLEEQIKTPNPKVKELEILLKESLMEFKSFNLFCSVPQRVLNLVTSIENTLNKHAT